MCTNLVLLLPVLKQLHEGVALLHQLWVHAFNFCEGQDGFQSALSLTGCPQTSAGGGKSVVHQSLFILNHFFKDGCLTLHPDRNFFFQMNHLDVSWNLTDCLTGVKYCSTYV